MEHLYGSPLPLGKNVVGPGKNLAIYTRTIAYHHAMARVCNGTSSAISKKTYSRLKFYLDNNKKFWASSPPARFYFYGLGEENRMEWMSFGEECVARFKESFAGKLPRHNWTKGRDQEFTANFEEMLVWSEGDGCGRSIAWVDEDGRSFFPVRPFLCGCWTTAEAAQAFMNN
ncbi:hypothetical protein KSP40_PGU015817 [Platanthera guangdongensis]|uniref:RCD1 WWE domain-containing protein n=1 Tax=Platanthera guangdongensis TaxID=2320717 RepID=A0ABR2MKT9_9ASPA